MCWMPRRGFEYTKNDWIEYYFYFRGCITNQNNTDICFEAKINLKYLYENIHELFITYDANC